MNDTGVLVNPEMARAALRGWPETIRVVIIIVVIATAVALVQ